MTRAASLTLKPRKSAIQARAAATVSTLHIAAIQVLTREGLSRCTTTRIAERAGISVGSLYQYYPNRDALLAAILQEHLEDVAATIERVCRDHQGKGVSRMASALVVAFLSAKRREPEKSRALFAIAEGRGGKALARRLHRRIVEAVTHMLASAMDAHFDNPAMVSTAVLGVLVGAVQILLEGQVAAGFDERLEKELIALLNAYFGSYRQGPKRAVLNGLQRR